MSELNNLLNSEEVSSNLSSQIIQAIGAGTVFELKIDNLTDISPELINLFFEQKAFSQLKINLNGEIVSLNDYEALILEKLQSYKSRDDRFNDLDNFLRYSKIYDSLNQRSLDVINKEYLSAESKLDYFLNMSILEKTKFLNSLEQSQLSALLKQLQQFDIKKFTYIIKNIDPKKLDIYFETNPDMCDSYFKNVPTYEIEKILMNTSNIEIITENLFSLESYQIKSVLNHYSIETISTLYNELNEEQKMNLVESLTLDKIIALKDVINLSYIGNIYGERLIEIYNNICENENKVVEFIMSQNTLSILLELKKNNVDLNEVLDLLNENQLNNVLTKDAVYEAFLNFLIRNVPKQLVRIFPVITAKQKVKVLESGALDNTDITNVFNTLSSDDIKYISDYIEVSLKLKLLKTGHMQLGINLEDGKVNAILDYTDKDLPESLIAFFGDILNSSVVDRLSSKHNYWSELRFKDEVNDEKCMAYNNIVGNFYNIRYKDYVLKSNIVHESVHEVSRNGTDSGFHVTKDYLGINECVTEYFSELILGKEYPTNVDGKIHCGYQVGVSKLKQMLDYGISNLEELKTAYMTNDVGYFNKMFTYEELTTFLSLYNEVIVRDTRNEASAKLDQFIVDYVLNHNL